MLDLGRHVIDALGPVFELFKDETVAPSIALWLVALACACALWLLLGHIVPLSLALRRRIAVVRRDKDKHAFATSFDRVDKVLRQGQPFGHAWGEFRQVLIDPDPDEAQPVIRNTIRPAFYFNLHDLGLHFRGFHALPNVFVGLGLLFTFVGLVAALHFAAQGVGEADLEHTQEALTNLLHAATFKFYTSIAGLLSSLAFGFLLRASISHLERRLDDLCEALEQRMVFETAEGIAFRGLLEAKEQTRQLKVFNTDLAMTLGQQLEAALDRVLPQHLVPATQAVGEHLGTLPSHLQTAVEPVVQRLDRVVQDLAQQSSTGIGDLAREFHANLQDAAGNQMRSLASSVGQLVETLNGTSGQIGSSGNQLAGQVQAASAELVAAAAAIGTTVRELSAQVRSDAAASADAKQEQLEKLQAAMSEMSDRVAGVMGEAERRVRDSAATAAGEMGQRLADAAAALERSAAMIGTTIGQATQELALSSNQAGAALRERGGEIAGQLAAASRAAAEEAERHLRGAAQGMSEELRTVAAQMAAAMGALVEQLRATTQGVTSVNARLDDHCRALDVATDRAKATAVALDGNAASLNKASAPLLQVGQTIASSVDGLAKSNASAVATFKATQQQAETLARELAETLEELRDVWRQHAGRFHHVDEELGKAFEKMVEGAKGNAQAIRDFTNEIDNGLADSVGRIGGAVEALGEFTQEMQKIVEQLAQARRQAA